MPWAVCCCARSSPLRAQKRQVLACPALYRTGAPRSMKMGTTSSPWRYDAGTCRVLLSPELRQRTIARYPTQMPQIGNNCGSGFRSVQSVHIRQGYPAHVHRKISLTILIRKISFALRAACDTIHVLARNTASEKLLRRTLVEQPLRDRDRD